jgi:two-component system, chemotaxis family, chemotaxis protein CheY
LGWSFESRLSLSGSQREKVGFHWVNMSKKILISDDAMFMRAMLRGILIENEYAVYEASNGQEAIDQYEAHKPDLVFMDITMPVMDGIAATRAIKEKNPGANIVMCSAMGQQSMVIEAVRAGAKDFIVKPFQAERVLECVRKLVA